MSEFIKDNNFDDVFIRDVYASVCYFFLDTLSIPRIVDGKKERVSVPVLPNQVGSENFMKDFFANSKIICGDLSVDNLVSRVPSGRINMNGGLSIDSSNVMQNAIRTKRLVDNSNDFFNDTKEMYGMRTILGVNMNFNISFKCSSQIERLKLIEELIKNFYRERNFYFSSQGIKKIPCYLSLSDSFKFEKDKQFKFSQSENLYYTDVTFDCNTFLVIDDNVDNMSNEQKTIDFKINNVNK